MITFNINLESRINLSEKDLYPQFRQMKISGLIVNCTVLSHNLIAVFASQRLYPDLHISPSFHDSIELSTITESDPSTFQQIEATDQGNQLQEWQNHTRGIQTFKILLSAGATALIATSQLIFPTACEHYSAENLILPTIGLLSIRMLLDGVDMSVLSKYSRLPNLTILLASISIALAFLEVFGILEEYTSACNWDSENLFDNPLVISFLLIPSFLQTLLPLVTSLFNEDIPVCQVHR